MENKQLSPGEIVLLASGALALLASFLPWVDAGGFSANAWSSDVLFPVSWLVPMLALAAAALYALGKFTGVNLPANLLGYSPSMLIRTLAFMGALLAIAWVIAIEEAGLGFWLSVLAAVGATVGVLMMERSPSGQKPSV